MQITLVIREKKDTKEVRGGIPFQEDQTIQHMTMTRVTMTCCEVTTFFAEL